MLLQSRVFEERVEGLERWIDVRDPQHQEFFEGDLAVGNAVGLATQPLGGADLSAEHVDVGELLGERQEQAFELLRLGLRGEPTDCLGENGGVDLLAVAGDQRMAEFVDQAHGKHGAGVDRARWIGVRAAGLVQRLG